MVQENPNKDLWTNQGKGEVSNEKAYYAG